MNTEFGLTNGPFNTKFAPLAALGLCFRQDGTLKYFDQVTSETGQPDFSPATKLIQVLSSMLAGCEYLCEVNGCLRSEMLSRTIFSGLRAESAKSNELGPIGAGQPVYLAFA